MNEVLRGKLEKIYFSVIQYGTYLALFTPLILARQFFFPFVSPKSIFFRIIVDIIFIAYILLAVSNKKYRPRFNVLSAAIGIFLCVIIFTSAIGVDFQKSFWSVFERMTGILTFLHLYVFFIILTSVFKKRSDWEKIFSVSIVVGVLCCFYTWGSSESASRGGGTLGNTSFLAGYLLFDIFFALILFLTKTGWVKIAYFSGLLILIAGLFISREPCRGAIGAFLGGMFIFALGYMFFSGKDTLKKLAPVVLVASVLLVVGISQTSFFKSHVLDTDNIPGLSREIVWKIGLDGWQERFLFGWGLENFNIPFVKYFDPELPLTIDIWYDRAHNIIIDTAVESGLIGLISYLAIFGIAVFEMFRSCSRVAIKKNVFLPLGMIAVLASYIAQNIWVFDMISSYMMLFLTLAFVSFLISSKNNTENSEVEPQKQNYFSPAIGAVLIIITLFTLYFGNIQPARASMNIVKAIYAPLAESISSFEKALAVSPMAKFEAPEQLSTRIINLAAEGQTNTALLQKGLEFAEGELKKNIERNPLDYRTLLFLGRYYDNVYQVTGSSTMLDLAEKTLNEALKASPKNQQTYWSLAQTRIFQTRYDEAIEFMKIAIDLEPRLPQSHWYLGLTYKIAKNYELAAQEMEEAKNLGDNWMDNISELKQVIEVYKTLGNFEKLNTLYERAVQLSDSEAQLWAGLAEASARMGDRERAKTAAEELLKLSPDLATSVAAFIKELGY